MLFLLFFFSIFSYCREIYIETEHLEFNDLEKEVNIYNTSTTLKFSGISLSCKNLSVDLASNTVYGYEDVILEDGKNVFKSNEIFYELNKNEGKLHKVSGTLQTWYIKSQELQNKATEEYKIKKCDFTTCELIEPHYHFHSSYLDVIPGKKISARNIIFFVSKIPILYLPFYSYSLKERKTSIEIYPGYKDGLNFKVIYGFPITSFSYNRIYLDYFANGVLGKGLEFNIWYKDKFNGSIFGYHVKDQIGERWNFRTGFSHSILEKLITNGYLNFMSDRIFSNYYFTEDWNRVYSSLLSSLSTTYRGKNSTVKISTEREEIFNSSTGAFELNRFTIPRIDFNLYAKPIKRFLLDGNISSKYEFLKGSGYSFTSDFKSGIARNYQINKNLSFTPKFGISESLYFDLSRQYFLTKYVTEMKLKSRPLEETNIDFLYFFDLRSKENSLSIDTQERNLSMFIAYFNPFKTISSRFYTGYNFLLNNFEPFINDIVFNFSKTSLYFKLNLNPQSFVLNSYLFDISLNLAEGQSFSFAFVFNESSPSDYYDGVFSTKKWITKSMFLDFRMISSLIEDFQIKEKTVNIYYDLHCWELKLSYRSRFGLEEFFFLLTLKASEASRKKLYNLELERDIYPWR